MQLASGQSAGRLERAQLHDVRARQPDGLRQLAGAGQPGLGLRRRTVLLQKVGGQPEPVSGADAVPLDGRLLDRVGGAVQDAAGGRVRARRPGDGLRHSRHKRRAADGLHGSAGHDPARGPVQHGQGVLAASPAPEEPARVHQRTRHPRGCPPGDEGRVRRRDGQRRHAAFCPGQQRGHTVRRVHQLCAAPHAFRNRSQGPSDRDGHTRFG